MAQKGRVEAVFAVHGVSKSEPNDVFRRHKTPNEVRTFGRNGAKDASRIDKLTSVVENLVFFTESIAVTDKENKIVCNFGGSFMIMNKSIPKQIQLIMSREGLNYCETFDNEGKTYYFLSYVSENGEPQPTGLPIIYYIDKDKPVQLSFDKSLLILSKLPDDGEE